MNKQLIGEKLRELRGNRTREEVAVAARVTASAIWMYEAGQRTPSDETKVRLANYFGTSVTDIFFPAESTGVDTTDDRSA